MVLSHRSTRECFAEQSDSAIQHTQIIDRQEPSHTQDADDAMHDRVCKVLTSLESCISKCDSHVLRSIDTITNLKYPIVQDMETQTDPEEENPPPYSDLPSSTESCAAPSSHTSKQLSTRMFCPTIEVAATVATQTSTASEILILASEIEQTSKAICGALYSHWIDQSSRGILAQWATRSFVKNKLDKGSERNIKFLKYCLTKFHDSNSKFLKSATPYIGLHKMIPVYSQTSSTWREQYKCFYLFDAMLLLLIHSILALEADTRTALQTGQLKCVAQARESALEVLKEMKEGFKIVSDFSQQHRRKTSWRHCDCHIRPEP